MTSEPAPLVGAVKAPVDDEQSGPRFTVLAADAMTCEGDFCFLPDPGPRTASAVDSPGSAS